MAAVAGVGSFRVGVAQLDVLAAIGATAFLSALAATVLRSAKRTERDWYGGRAAAESLRTLAWRYAVGGDPFPTSLNGRIARGRYLDRIQLVLNELIDTPLPAVGHDGDELTIAMQAVRDADLAERRNIYRRDRIDDQISWCGGRANKHERLARIWLATTVLANIVGLVGSGLKFFGSIDLEVLGVAAACASAAIGWSQLNQHRTNMAVYRLAARELSIIRSRIAAVPDESWPAFVSDSEEAISREHVMWAARHGHPVLQRGMNV